LPSKPWAREREVVVAATRWWEQCGNHIQAGRRELARRLASLHG